MRLDFNPSQAVIQAGVVVLTQGDARTELYLKTCGDLSEQRDLNESSDKSYTLIAFSRVADSERIARQGPYTTRAQAVAARTAIINELLRLGYEVAESQPLWELKAQQEISRIRQTKSQSGGNYAFDPKDVFFDFP
ncbi:hypothetical protein [Halioxenophilus sp. WMMB6]|uniref:PA4575 family protein n=1 Tax=Halioxenophilus sp. WMMB6 TaxID=3073815 RepID=UPI00295F2F58|nr:hypothetical protein [Halioxenophilus sp. WMMB6]